MGRIALSKHFFLDEFACKCHRCRGKEEQYLHTLHPHMIEVSEGVRSLCGEFAQQEVPLIINSGIRCKAYQKQLISVGYPAAITSPHVPEIQTRGQFADEEISFGVDYAIPRYKKKGEYKAIPFEVFLEFFIRTDPDLRLGFELYHRAFIHGDNAYRSTMQKKPAAWVVHQRW